MTYLKGNLSALRTKQAHHELIARLEPLGPCETLPEGYQVATGPNGDITLLFEGQPLHDLDSPKAEAQQLVIDGLTPHRHGQNLILGLGLGYVLQEACQVKETNHFASLITVYEPDLALLHFILSNVDLRAYLMNTHITLFHEPLGFLQHVRANYIQGDGLGILITPGALAAHRSEWMTLLRHIKSTVGTACRVNRTKQLQAKQWGTQFLANLPAFVTRPSFDGLAGTLQGHTVVVCDEGPSLRDAMANLQLVASRVAIVATPRAAGVLKSQGLTPQFVVWMDAVDEDGWLCSGEPLWPNSHLITSPTVPSAVLQQPAQSQWVALNELFGPFLDKVWGHSLKRYPSGGATLQMALHLAATLEPDHLIVLGIESCPNTDTQPPTPDETTTVPGWCEGQSVRVSEAWAELGLMLETSATRLLTDRPSLRLVNASQGSPRLAGYEHVPFESLMPALAQQPPVELRPLITQAQARWSACHPTPSQMAQAAQGQLVDLGNRMVRALGLIQQAQPLITQLLAAPAEQILTLSEPYSAVFNSLAATIESHPMLKEWLYHEQLMLYQGHNDTASTYKEHLSNFEQDRQYLDTLLPVLQHTLLPAIVAAQQALTTQYPAVSDTALASV
jgi:Protein of unknown function DUF115